MTKVISEHMLNIIKIHQERDAKLVEARRLPRYKPDGTINMSRWAEIGRVIRYRKDEEKKLWNLYFEEKFGNANLQNP